MAVDLAGLKAKAMTARANYERLGKAYDAFNAAAPAHASEVETMAEQLGEMQADLDAAVRTLGNSPAAPPASLGSAPGVLPNQAAPVIGLIGG